MPLVASISGVRGVMGDGLTPAVIVRYAGAFAAWCRQQQPAPTVVVGRDGRTTGDLCARLVTATLQASGCHVVYADLATTPTIQMAVQQVAATGGIILSASHNPEPWNALKLFNDLGEYLTPAQASVVLAMAEAGEDATVPYEHMGTFRTQDFLGYHLDQILALPFLHPEQIAARRFKVVVDGVNSVGSVVMPSLLRRLGVDEITVLNAEVTGRFAHNPEPLPEHLTEILHVVRDTGADLGLVVDPDVDRLAFVEDGGRFFGEELTQVLVADFLMRHTPGPFVTNLSSSRAIDEVMARYGQPSVRSAVGEINVVLKMKEVGAVLGGEGNGGVILPALHYGRDALVGAAMALQYLAERNVPLSTVRAELPTFVMGKHKLDLAALPGVDPKALLAQVAAQHAGERISTVDGVKLDFDEGWVHLRTSNTEPIVRIYTEARTAAGAEALAQRFTKTLQALATG